jgi:hypothetical protein
LPFLVFGFWLFPGDGSGRAAGGGADVGAAIGGAATVPDGGGGAMSRSIFFGGRPSLPFFWFNSFLPAGASAETALTPAGAWVPATNGLPTAGVATTGLATGFPVRSIWTSF